MPLFFETVLFGFTLAALPGRIRNGLAGRTLIDIVVRDGTWAFAVIFRKCLPTRALRC